MAVVLGECDAALELGRAHLGELARCGHHPELVRSKRGAPQPPHIQQVVPHQASNLAILPLGQLQLQHVSTGASPAHCALMGAYRVPSTSTPSPSSAGSGLRRLFTRATGPTHTE
eukprot:CAMPEP_0119427826 /NCGR_PEP_ID=MMETSP1335-20130426/39182_1 /TAXON_ID=259385 /ORGANISM="Chrysoculter rhomboideus, Strain RCC1486" /LENGTH=114 /DNA_ID=CAMNT_0007453487 /DNA_START=65 /DNA_END=410 /DNA_ORIENTATION=-